MLNKKKIVVVMPAYNAALTLEETYRSIPFEVADDVVIVDDASDDNTIEVAKNLGIKHIVSHKTNLGYGGNQKTCYDYALNKLKADIIIMLHPDYQYTPALIPAMSYLIANKVYPVVLGSRILGKSARKGGMPLYKYFANRILTFVQNILLNQKLSEYHTGYRAYSAEVLKKINYRANSNGFVFDNQVLSQVFMAGFQIGEISCPVKYFPEASSINFKQSIIYGFGVIKTSIMHLLHNIKLFKFKIYKTQINE